MKKIISIISTSILAIGISGWFVYNYYLAPHSEECQLQKNMAPFTHTNFPKHIPFKQKNGFINDASCLNQTPIYGIIDIRTEENIRDALAFAKENNLKVAAIGVRHSMGGQAFYKDALILDMSNFNDIKLNYKDKTIAVQSGATWRQIQEFLHPYHLSVKAMQSSNIFSVGGSISVNAHGMDHRTGSVSSTVHSLRIMLADGSIKKISPQDNKKLFDLVVGGYGLFGIILDAHIEVTDNVMYEEVKFTIPLLQLPETIEEVIHNPEIEIFYAHLSTSPVTFLKQALVFTYKPYTKTAVEIPPLHSPSFSAFKRMLLNLSKSSFLGKLTKWVLEKYFNDCEIVVEGTKECLISRNAVMYDSVEYLKSNLSGQTDILHEYFIPIENLVPFIKELRTILIDQNATLLNCSIRLVHKEDNFLTYATRPLVAVVLYLNQSISDYGNMKMLRLTQSIIDSALEHGGTFFLPYQLYFTHEQLLRSYPQWPDFVKQKQQYDPATLFTQHLYEKYKD